MDYKLAALKLFCINLKDARETPGQKNTLTLGGILFQRVWLQGLLVSISPAGDRLLLDDGTGLIHLCLSSDLRQRPWKIGMYVMVVGAYAVRTDQPPLIRVHKIVDLSAFPNREAMWYLEVMEAYELFYEPLVKEFV
ncbi:hypothetical protein UlMin_012653 [Ulmus minor]